MNLFIDIETLGTNDETLVDVRPPKTMSKPETIAKWEVEEKPRAVKEALARTSFDSILGRICCVCFAIDDGPVFCFSHDDEKTLLEQLYRDISQVSRTNIRGFDVNHSLTIVGHNVAGFDLPFLKHRSLIHNVKPPAEILKAMSAKPWDACIADTMLMWSSDREKRVSVDKLCVAFGIPGKGDFDGSMVADTWPIDPQKVIDYCADDVRRTQDIYHRLKFKEFQRIDGQNKSEAPKLDAERAQIPVETNTTLTETVKQPGEYKPPRRDELIASIAFAYKVSGGTATEWLIKEFRQVAA